MIIKGSSLLHEMKVKVMSDTHNDHHKIHVGSCDLLIHSGDFGIKGNLTEALDFLWWFNKQNAKYKILVPGNHDKKMQPQTEHPDAIKLAKDLGIILLRNEGVTIEQRKIYGVCTTFKGIDDPRFRDSEWGSDEDRINAWKDIPSGLDLLITHMPPFGILDYVDHKNEHIGCPELLKKITEVQPDVHIFGHVHEQAGKSEYNAEGIQTTFYNMACKNRQYELIRNTYELEF